TKENVDASQAGKKAVPGKDYILLPLWTQDPPIYSNSKDSLDAGFKPSEEDEKKDESEAPSAQEQRVNHEKDANANITNSINTVSSLVNAADIKDDVVDENIVYGCADDLNIPPLEKIDYSNDDEDVDAEPDMNNLDTYIQVSYVPTTRIHKDHPLEQVIGDLYSAPRTRKMS
ncbi:hypothetical protein Tco_0075061, partial [Tanacetum coccineum]